MSRRGLRTGELRWDDLVAYPRPSVLTVVWRWRAEIGLAAGTAAASWLLGPVLGWVVLLILALTAAGLVAAIPGTRRWIVAHGACTLTRHRLYAVLREIRATTRTGRLPLVMRVSPTPTGERAVLWLRAGVSVHDLQSHVEELRAGCWVPDVRVRRSRTWPQVVILELLRRPPAPADDGRPLSPAATATGLSPDGRAPRGSVPRQPVPLEPVPVPPVPVPPVSLEPVPLESAPPESGLPAPKPPAAGPRGGFTPGGLPRPRRAPETETETVG
jgi:hypothetical protein